MPLQLQGHIVPIQTTFGRAIIQTDYLYAFLLLMTSVNIGNYLEHIHIR